MERLARGLVGFGIGFAVTFGWGTPVAAADPGDSTSSDSSESSGSSAGTSPSEPKREPSSTSDPDPTSETEPEPAPSTESESGPSGDEESNAEPPAAAPTVAAPDHDDDKGRKRPHASFRVNDAPDVEAARDVSSATPPARSGDTPSAAVDTASEPVVTPTEPEVSQPVESVAAVAVDPVPATTPEPEPTKSATPATPDLITGLITGLAEALTAPFAPLAAPGGPLAPAGEPAAWALMSVARRELDQAFTTPSLDAPAASATSAVPLDPTDVAAAALPPADQSLYTGQPSFISQVVTLGLRVVDFVLRPFGGILAFTSLDIPIFTDGIPPFFLTHGLDVKQTEYEGMKVWTLTPASPTEKVIVGLHGGAYVAEASLFHWWTYTDMARDTGATVVVPLYPLIPEGTAARVVPTTTDFIASMITEHGAENVSVIGDSAGGGLALAAVQELVKRGSPVPSRLVLLAPWLDATVSDPRSTDLDADDPLLDVPNLQQDGIDWAGDLGADHPWASPINGSLAGLPPTTVISGSLDLLTPDSLRLLERTQTEGLTNFTFHLHNGQIHDWPIFAFIPDAIATRPEIYRGLLGT